MMKSMRSGVVTSTSGCSFSISKVISTLCRDAPAKSTETGVPGAWGVLEETGVEDAGVAATGAGAGAGAWGWAERDPVGAKDGKLSGTIDGSPVGGFGIGRSVWERG
jgi:hypothetical protein